MAQSSKDAILQTLRQNPPETAELPDLQQDWVQFDDPHAQFAEVLQAVGGRAVFVQDLQQLNAELGQIAAFRDAQKTASLVAGVAANVDLASLQDPHQAEDIDYFIAGGEFAVAENGAVWVTGQHTPHRVLFFIAQHVALVVDADRVLNNLHEAYQRIRFDEPGFGLFISGPSKTADIEQSLVIGAHGPRSLTVFLVRRMDQPQGASPPVLGS